MGGLGLELQDSFYSIPGFEKINIGEDAYTKTLLRDILN